MSTLPTIVPNGPTFSISAFWDKLTSSLLCWRSISNCRSEYFMHTAKNSDASLPSQAHEASQSTHPHSCRQTPGACDATPGFFLSGSYRSLFYSVLGQPDYFLTNRTRLLNRKLYHLTRSPHTFVVKFRNPFRKSPRVFHVLVTCLARLRETVQTIMRERRSPIILHEPHWVHLVPGDTTLCPCRRTIAASVPQMPGEAAVEYCIPGANAKG
jgi:hypothetical protein